MVSLGYRIRIRHDRRGPFADRHLILLLCLDRQKVKAHIKAETLKFAFRQGQQGLILQRQAFLSKLQPKQTDIYRISIIPLALSEQPQEAGGLLFPVCKEQNLRINESSNNI